MSRVRIISRDPNISADFYIHATTSISRKVSADIPQFPVETGFNVSDTVTKKNMVMSITGLFTWTAFGIDNDQWVDPIQAFDLLFELNRSGSKLTVEGYDRTHDDMYLTDVDLVKKEGGLEVSLTLQQVRTTTSQFVVLPDVAEDIKDQAAGEKPVDFKTDFRRKIDALKEGALKLASQFRGGS